MEKRDPMIACTDCGHKFGRWRMRCPACGTSNSQRASLSEAVETFYAKDNPTAARVQPKPTRAPKERASDECIFCRRGKANAICQTCHEPIHSRCINLHLQICTDFVEGVEKETERISKPVAPGRSALENSSGLADALNRLLKPKG